MSTSSHFSVLSAQISSLSYLWIQKGRRYQSNVCRDVGTSLQTLQGHQTLASVSRHSGNSKPWWPHFTLGTYLEIGSRSTSCIYLHPVSSDEAERCGSYIMEEFLYVLQEAFIKNRLTFCKKFLIVSNLSVGHV